MNKFFRSFLITFNIIFLISFTSCSNKEITIIKDDLRKVNVLDHSGLVIKTYYEKYSNDYGGWLKTSCSYDILLAVEKNLENSKNKCSFSKLTLNRLNRLKNDDNEDEKFINNSNKISLEEENNQEIEETEEEEEEEETEEEEEEEETEEEKRRIIVE